MGPKLKNPSPYDFNIFGRSKSYLPPLSMCAAGLLICHTSSSPCHHVGHHASQPWPPHPTRLTLHRAHHLQQEQTQQQRKHANDGGSNKQKERKKYIGFKSRNLSFVTGGISLVKNAH
ncbi:hypothetical protein V6Z11_A04G069600 [Gossypium hirsutum]